MSTSLLAHCDGSSFVDETGRTVTAVGNAAISTAQFAPLAGNAASGFFDGTGDYLTVPDSPDFDFGAGDFTIECFVYRSVSGVSYGLVSKHATNTAFAPFNLFLASGGQPSFRASFDGTTWGVNISSPSGLTVGTWNHVAATRSEDVWSLYVNGVRRATATALGTLMVNTSAVVLGGDTNTWSLNGHLDEVRIDKGTAFYTGATVPVPTAPFTYSAGSSFAVHTASTPALVGWKLRPPVTGFLLHMDGVSGGGTFVDSSLAANVVSKRGTPTTSSAVAPVFGTTSMLGGLATGLYITNSEALQPTQDDFTIELWVRPTSRAAEAVLVSKFGGQYSYGAVEFVMKAGGTLEGRFSADTLTLVQTVTTTATIPASAWTHVALCRCQGVVSIYIGGVLKASAPLTVNLSTATHDWSIGQANGARGFTGNIDEVRYTYGQSVYTADFTVPTSPFSLAGLTTTSFDINTGSVVAGVGLGTMHGTEFRLDSGSGVTTDASLVNTHTAALLHFDGGDGSTLFVDECHNRVERFGTPEISTSQGKYGSQSALFAATDRLRVYGTYATFDIGRNRFLFEAWIYSTSRVDGDIISGAGATLRVTADGHLWVSAHPAGGPGQGISLEYLTPIPLNTWVHVGVGVDWYGLNLFVNGTARVTTPDTGAETYHFDDSLDPSFTVGNGFVGYIDEVRFTNGVFPYYGAFPSVVFSPPAPFRIPDSSTAAFFIQDSTAASFDSSSNLAGPTAFSIGTGTALAVASYNTRLTPRTFSIDGATTTRFDGWLLIGAESYFTVDTGSDFWFRSSGIIADPPGFSIATGSVVSFVSPAQPVATKARFFIDTASDFAPRTHVARAGAFAIWPRARVMWKTGQNAPYVFSIQAGSLLGMKGVALREMTYALAAGSDVLFAARGAAPSRFSMDAGAVGTFASRKYNGGGYSIPTETILALFSGQGYLEPSKPYVGFENIFFLQAHAAKAVLTALDSATFLEQT